ncbi:agmatine deiminase family protein [Macellibacteroides fermentans]|uniref:agmatine deiminase family protein n=1 Tax=Macellibacteroides fermentans TaxID=879969 RepID=UPI00352EB866
MLLTDYDTNMVYFSEWIRDFACFNSISEVLKRHCINFEPLPFTKDYWIRDFMPVQIAESVFVEYKYNPDYLQSKRAFITDPKGCCTHLHILTQRIDVVLDGGNIIKCRDSVIMTGKVFAENPTFTKWQLYDTLEEAFQCRVIVIPWDRYEKYGHADGMVRYIDKERILLNNYINFDMALRKKLISALEGFYDIVELDYRVAKRSKLSWAYINFLQVGSFILLPAIGAPEDKLAFKQFSDLFNGHQIEQVNIADIVQLGGAFNCISWNIKI